MKADDKPGHGPIDYPDPQVSNLRDQFAMAALTGILAETREYYAATEMSQLAYEMADAMIMARKVWDSTYAKAKGEQ